MELVIEGVGKRYKGDFWGLRGFSLSLKPGVLGLLGPNGAGKSTLMRILATITKPTEGRVLWNGEDIARKPDGLRSVLGYLPQDFGVYPNLTAEEFLEYLAAVKGLDGGVARRRIGELLALVNLTDARKKPLGGYSGGMKQRIGIAQALLNDPRLLIVDEPTVGLDPEERVRFRNLLSELSGDRIVILSTHIVSDVEATANEIAIVDHGRLLTHAEPEALLRNVEGTVWDWVLSSADLPAARERWKIGSTIRRTDGVHARVVSSVPPAATATPLTPTLEDAYLAVLEGEPPIRQISRIGRIGRIIVWGRGDRGGGMMKTLLVLWHMLRADFLERVRRYSFLVTLAATVWLGYLFGTGKLGIWIGDARGVFNSAWIGTAMALVINTFLALFGFYVVKGSVDRDRQTGVGQILATTPLTKPLYTLGKAASNFAVLASMVSVLAVASVVIQLTAGEDPHVHLVTLLMPFVLLSLPLMALVAATSVLFETTPGLKGGFGNIIWFFLWVGGLASGIGKPDTNDLIGIGQVYGRLTRVYQANFGTVPKGFVIGGVEHAEPVRKFLWNGIDWTVSAATSRLVWVVLAVGVSFLAALFFDRFDPSRGGLRRQARAGGPNGEPIEVTLPVAARPEPVTLTPLVPAQAGGASFRFTAVLLAELKLALKGQRWWWYAGAAGLFLAGLLNQPQAVKEIVLPLTWLWPILVWSPLGTRESRFDTGGLLFSSARPLLRQLPATWLAGVLLAMATGSGAAVRFLAAGDHTALGAWLVGALFIPTLALALGVWSGTSKLFEALYLAIWYIGALNHVATFDYLGSSKTGAAEGMPLIYLGLTAALAVAAVGGRKRQLAG